MASLQPPHTLREYPLKFYEPLLARMSQGCPGCHKGALRKLGTTHGLDTDQLRILITPDIRKAFTETSSSLIFPWHPHRHCSQMKIMIRKSLTIFRDPVVHPAMCNWGLSLNDRKREYIETQYIGYTVSLVWSFYVISTHILF